jgi:hypothetical protein
MRFPYRFCLVSKKPLRHRRFRERPCKPRASKQKKPLRRRRFWQICRFAAGPVALHSDTWSEAPSGFARIVSRAEQNQVTTPGHAPLARLCANLGRFVQEEVGPRMERVSPCATEPRTSARGFFVERHIMVHFARKPG